MIDHSLEAVENPDVILITGDFLAHGFDTKTSDNPNYELLKQTLEKAIRLIQEAYPNTPILPSIGNHDTKVSATPPI